MRRFLVASTCAGLIVVGAGVVTAEQPPLCQAAEIRFENSERRRESQNNISARTRLALADINEEKIVASRADPARVRDSIIHVKELETDDQDLVGQRMEVVYCQIIFSTPNRGDDEKQAEFNNVKRAIWRAEPYEPLFVWPEPQQPSQSTRQSRRNDWWGLLIQSSYADEFEAALNAQDEPSSAPEIDFLSKSPLYVNDTNKYFVIVASTLSEDEGIRVIKEFAEKTPQYKFALYPRYGDNCYFAVMMATWVSKDVKDKALALARRDVEPEAYPWCYPDGPCDKSTPSRNTNKKGEPRKKGDANNESCKQKPIRRTNRKGDGH